MYVLFLPLTRLVYKNTSGVLQGLLLISKPIRLSETFVSGINCVGMKSTNLRLQFGMERKTFFAINEKVRNYRPDYIGLYILSKLRPLKSLKRFECVHRAWSLLCKNTHFMNIFLNNFLFNLNCCSYYYGASLLYSYS